jgi:hypothetical protein
MMLAMRWMRWAIVICACAASLGAPSAALAKEIIINPPGSAGANEYSEVIPSAAGNVSPPSGGGGSGNSASGVTPLGQGRAGIARLRHLGSDGRAAAALAASGAPTPAPSSKTRAGSGSPAVTSNGSASAGLASALTGSDAGGLGLALPLLLATCLIGAIGIVASRLRRREGPTELNA